MGSNKQEAQRTRLMSLKAELKRAYKSHDWVKVCLLHTQIRNFEKNMKGEQDYGNNQTDHTSQEG